MAEVRFVVREAPYFWDVIDLWADDIPVARFSDRYARAEEWADELCALLNQPYEEHDPSELLKRQT